MKNLRMTQGDTAPAGDDTKQPPGSRSGRNSSRGSRPRDWLNEPGAGVQAIGHRVIDSEPDHPWLERWLVYHTKSGLQKKHGHKTTWQQVDLLVFARPSATLPAPHSSVHSEAYLRDQALNQRPQKWILSLLGSKNWLTMSWNSNCKDTRQQPADSENISPSWSGYIEAPVITLWQLNIVT